MFRWGINRIILILYYLYLHCSIIVCSIVITDIFTSFFHQPHLCPDSVGHLTVCIDTYQFLINEDYYHVHFWSCANDGIINYESICSQY